MAFSETIKLNVKKKSHFTCCLCRSGIGVEIHHIIPQEEKGLDTEDNAAPVCPSCHETYGANPQKRKFIKEARDFWYELCEKKYTSEKKLDEIKELLGNSVSYDDLQELKDELLAHLKNEIETPRSEAEIIEAIDELFDKVWYNRHKILRMKVEEGESLVNEEIWKGALKAAAKVEKKYGKKALGPWDDFDWGMINGKLSALRWVLGDEWDMLDT